MWEDANSISVKQDEKSIPGQKPDQTCPFHFKGSVSIGDDEHDAKKSEACA